MTRETITIHFDYDSWLWPWVATFASYDGPESPIGHGKDPLKACKMLLEAINWELPE